MGGMWIFLDVSVYIQIRTEMVSRFQIKEAKILCVQHCLFQNYLVRFKRFVYSS